ncbi:type I-E CRISPR-associated protein Cse1/CasA [Pseudonocardia sp. H11422]|uniref:type I-E CRISPR-associated protein Cse1/CasA n=1 Tax=Pseudonocardia sp. H11422 TaxID=2835866 RepID=UPI00202831E8|nr:type I-E CRISPR-associated protein Cse1/CasA [Pseudonocardia sp. H11422]
MIHESWIPGRERDGTVVELGILRTLGRAHELAGISGDVPTQVFALTRLLLAVLHGALAGPRDLVEWEQLWTDETLPVDRIAPYLARYRDRFSLFHPETPFLQVAGLHTAKNEPTELSKLIADVPNGAPFFTTRLGGDLSLSYAEAARWLVHCHAFDPSGIKSGAVGDKRVKGGRGYPIGAAWSGLLGGVLLEGATLKQTLLLNLVPRDFLGYARDPQEDRPVWERDPVTAAEEVDGGRPPTGPVDLYVWQSRRIRLYADGCRVTRVLIANGERLTPQNKQDVEPHTAWRRSEAQEKKLGSATPVYMPREHDPDRAIWRGLESLLPGRSSRQGKTGGRFLAPGILEWLGHLGNEEVLPPDHEVRVRAIGMAYGSMSSVTDDIVHDTLALRTILATRGATEFAALATSCVDAADLAARAVGGLAADLAAAAGGEVDGPRSRASEQVYADLDAPFRSWLLTVGTGPGREDLQRAWHREAARVAQTAARELLDDIPPSCWAGRRVRNQKHFTAAHAEAQFWKAMYAALPLAFTKPPGQPDAAA